MKLLRHNGTEWKYGLEPKEGMLLRALVAGFSPTSTTNVKITCARADSKSAERERLLNESLAQHRQELKRQAGKLLAARLKPGKDDWRLSLNAAEREMLLQLLNDIRVENWRALGEPENLDTLPPPPSEADLRHYNFVQLAGYFEWKLLEETVVGQETRDEG